MYVMSIWPSLAYKNFHISAPRQKLKNLVSNFFANKLGSLHAIFQLSSFQAKGGV